MIIKIISLLDNPPNQLAKFTTKKCAEINDETHGTYSNNSQIKFKLQCSSQVFVIIVMRTYL